MLIGLFPELDAPGGIQRAGRHMAFVMSEFARENGSETRFLSLNDSRELHRMTVGEREFVYTGAARSKASFATTAFKAARNHGKLVLAAHPNIGPVISAMRLAAPKMKSIVCAHGVEVWEPLSPLRQRSLRRASLVLSPSQATAEYLKNLQGVPAEKIRILPWGLDPDFETRAAASSAVLPPDFPPGRVILTVGRWLATERYKGMDTLIKALPRLLLGRPDIQLVLVGEGDDRAWLENIAQESGVRRHVHFLRGLSYGELSACYAAAEIFALPSRGEGFGFVYLEAMARSKPVIAGAHGGAPEVVEDGVTGYVVQHGDIVQLATSLETLLADPELARQMGEKGRERVRNLYRFDVFERSFRKILSDLCAS